MARYDLTLEDIERSAKILSEGKPLAAMSARSSGKTKAAYDASDLGNILLKRRKEDAELEKQRREANRLPEWGEDV